MMNSEKINPRESVVDFSIIMERKLRENDYKGGWDDCDIDWLFKRAQEELGELREVLRESDSFDCNCPDVDYENEIVSEAADVANFIMMILDRMSLIENNRGIKRG